MREESKKRGDGSPVGVHVSTADGRNWAAQASDHGPYFRGKYGKLLKNS